MPDKKAERPEGQMRRRPMRRRKKVCAFCADANKVKLQTRFLLKVMNNVNTLICRKEQL